MSKTMGGQTESGSPAANNTTPDIANQGLNVDPAERDKFEQLAARWWDKDGEFRPLHDLNPARLGYVTGHAVVRDQAVLDVGCGGGILSESLAAAGARVTAIDVAEKALAVARLHLFESQLEVDYQALTVEELAQQLATEQDESGAERQSATGFQVITCMEMLEHVPQPWSVIQACADLLTPGGQIFFSTINRTPRAFALAIVGAEYALRLLPRGTHQYRKLIRPAELAQWCRDAGLLVEDISGLHYNPLTRNAWVGPGVAVNYLVRASKPGPTTDSAAPTNH